MKNKLVNEKINSILAESGIKNAERLLKYIKMDEIDLTDEFEVAGLEAQIETLKTDLPELFNPKAQRLLRFVFARDDFFYSWAALWESGFGWFVGA